MNAYSEHNGISIRWRGNDWDVPLGDAPYTQFIPFGTLEAAKAFIDAGRIPGAHVVFDMETQKAINPLRLA